MMKKIFMTVLVAAVAIGCNKQAPVDMSANDGEIRIFMGVESASSKAVATQTTGAQGVQFLKMDAATVPTDFSGVVADKKSGNIAPTSGQVVGPKFSYDKTPELLNAWMLAYYPAGDLAESVVTWTIDGQTDVMRTNTVWDAGTYVLPNTGEEGTKMVLNHELSRVEVTCVAESGSDLLAVRAAWGRITKIELVGTPTTMTYNLNTLTVANGAATADLSLLQDYAGLAFASIEVPEKNNKVVNAVAMVAPVAMIEGSSFKLRVTNEGVEGKSTPIVTTLNVKLSGDTATAMEKGKIHKVTLTFKADGKDIEIKNTTIEDWVDGSAASNDLNKPTA